MKKNIIIFILMHSMVSILLSQRFEEVNPHPEFCSMVSGIRSYCVGASCAMDMMFWADVIKTKNLGCDGYKNEFNNCPTSPDGKTPMMPMPIEYALEYVGSRNKIDARDTIEYCDYKLKQFIEIRNNLKYSEVNDERSPWDRPGVGAFYGPGLSKELIRYVSGREAHAVLIYGISIEYENNDEIVVTYKIHNPNWKNESEGILRGRAMQSFVIKNGRPTVYFPTVSFIVFFWLNKCISN